MNETKGAARARLEEMLCEKSVLQKIFGKEVFWIKALPRFTFMAEENSSEKWTLECDEEKTCLVYFSFIKEHKFDFSADNRATMGALFIIGHDNVERVDLIDEMEKRYSANPDLFAFSVFVDEDTVERD